MNIEFTVNGTELNNALNVVKNVTPRPFDRTGAAGYLIVIRGEKGTVYSRDAAHVIRASFGLTDVNGEGAFIYPSSHIQGFSFFEGQSIRFKVTKEGDSVLVKYSLDGDVGGERVSFDSKFMTTCDREFEESKNPCEFSVAFLREALALSKGFLSSSKEETAWKTLQVFDKEGSQSPDPKDPTKVIKPYERGDGYLYATNGSLAFYMYCSDFKGKSLSIHTQHVPLLQQFLGHCKGRVIITTGTNYMFAKDESSDLVFGWNHAIKQHSRFAYYSFSGDNVVVSVDRDNLLKAIDYTKSEMDPKSVRAKLVYDDADNKLQLQLASEGTHKGFASWRIDANTVSETKGRRSFTTNVSIDQLKSVVEMAKSPVLQLRVHFMEPTEKSPRGGVLFRTIDTFVLDQNGKVIGGSEVKNLPQGAAECTVTRFMPSYG